MRNTALIAWLPKFKVYRTMAANNIMLMFHNELNEYQMLSVVLVTLAACKEWREEQIHPLNEERAN